MIDVTQYTAHKHPGKFEGEGNGATEYFWEQMLNGDGEEIYAYNGDDDQTEADVELTESAVATLFELSAEEADAFELTDGRWFLLREDSQGFCYGTNHATREDAESKFREWIGA